ncbi:hypothetical protein [uncultured Enterococcus sp.]|uniref:Rgg family transcriptional regulator n=1 Tax=uncultured Enterococcus sp. TaxID=167972 RepID=UPI002AA83A4C|nr:hypothetical protein [uncultured Enterococcus sp.]
MKTSDLLRLYRSNNKQKQKELVGAEHVSNYSRIETGLRQINIDEFKTIKDNLSITAEEFVRMSDLDKEQEEFIQLYRYCLSHPKNKEKQKKLLSKYYFDKDIRKLSLREMSNYVAIKRLLSSLYTEVEELSALELDFICEYIMKRDFLTHYDYNILMNISSLISREKADIIIRKAFPVKYEDHRPYKTIIFAYGIIRNFITYRIYEYDYDSALKYIKLAKNQQFNSSNYEHRMHIQYLENLVYYLQTGKKDYSDKISRYIRLLEDIGDVANAKEVDLEFEQVNREKGNKGDIDVGNRPVKLILED